MDTLESLTSWIGVPLPPVYASLLAELPETSGCDIYLYDIGSLRERNETFDVREYSTRYLNIGDNGGGAAFVLDLEPPYAVFLVGHGSMHPDDFRPVSSSLSTWVANGFHIHRESEGEDWSRSVDVLVIAEPSELADLLAIRQAFAPSLPISLLRSQARQPPATITRMSYAQFAAKKSQVPSTASVCIGYREVSPASET